MAEETKPKWTMQRIHDDIYDARTKVFVINKVLEAGNPKLSEHPEWVLVLEPMLTDLVENAEKIRTMLSDSGKDSAGEE